MIIKRPAGTESEKRGRVPKTVTWQSTGLADGNKISAAVADNMRSAIPK
mgnify:CR=1